MKLTPPVDNCKNTLRPLCLLALSEICWVFVRTSFLQSPKKTWTFIVDQRSYTRAYIKYQNIIHIVFVMYIITYVA